MSDAALVVVVVVVGDSLALAPWLLGACRASHADCFPHLDFAVFVAPHFTVPAQRVG